MSRPFCPSVRTDNQAFRGSSISSSISLHPVGCKRRLCMFRCSVDQGGSGIQVFALLIRTVVVYYTQVSQVRVEGTEQRKRYDKKKKKWKSAISSKDIFRSNCPIESRSFFLRATLLKLHISAQLIESFLTPKRSCSCVEEKLSFRLYATASRTSS